MSRRLAQILQTCFLIFIPFFFWTITPSLFSQSKLFIVLTFGLLAGITFFATTITTRSLSIARSPHTLSLIIFFLAIVSSLIAIPEGRPEALASKGLLLLILPLISLILLTLTHPSVSTKHLTSSIMFISFALSLHSLAGLTFLPNLDFLPIYMQTKLFTPTGDYLTTLILIILGISVAIPKLNSSSIIPKFYAIATAVLGIISSIAIISLMLPGSPLALTLIPYKESWAIMLDAFKSMRSLFFGVGLANYSLLFTAVKPLSLNATTLWNLVPQAASSELLTIFTTTGIVGGFATIFLFIQSLYSSRHSQLYLPILILTLAFIFIPGSITLLTVYFILISSISKTTPTPLHLPSRLLLITSLAAILLLILGYSYSLKSIISEYYISRAQTALKNNDGKSVYDFHLLAIKYSPLITTYHLSFADTNISLASALSQKPSLSDEDKTTISTLVQQAVTEGKNATVLRPNASTSWLTLAKIYRNLIGVATGADNFAIENYAKAISLDPANPTLRVEFGGLLYQLGVSTQKSTDKDIYFNRAKTEFQTAIQLRNNLPNAYYNLSKLFETTGDYEGAYLALQKAISLLGPDNPDLSRATAELETLKSNLPEPSAPPSTQTEVAPPTSTDLATPSPLPSPLPSGSLDLDIK